MTPKKKNEYAPIINFLLILIAVYVSVHLAAAVKYAEMMNASQSDFYMTVLEYFSDTVTYKPFHFVICEYTAKYALYGGAGMGLVLLAIAQSKKNYIHGKEFGTARWGTKADIKDVFAENLMKEEIKQAQEVKHAYGRWKARQKVYDRISKSQKKKLEQAIQDLRLADEQAQEERGYNRRTAKKHLAEDIAEVRKQIAKETKDLKAVAWEPDRLKQVYMKRLKEIDESPFFKTDEERKAAKEQAKTDYDRNVREFFSGKNRIKKIREKYKDADAIFTKTERISIYNYIYNNNTMILGGSGSGKTRGFVMPNVLQAHSSYVITDPKGEILEKAGHFLTMRGYKIRVLNLDNKEKSDGYNPFVYLRAGQPGYEERVLSLIEAIIINTDGGEKKGGSDPFWDKAERLFLQALFFFVGTGFQPQDQNMNTVLNLIGWLEISEDDENMRCRLDFFCDWFASKFGEEHIGVQQFREFRRKASGKTAKSIVISAVARLAPFRTKAVRRIFSYDSMELDRLGEERMAIFVVVPPTDTTFNFIAGMVFSQMFQELQFCATQIHRDTQRLPVPVRFILDEFANTCKIPNFVEILAYARSFGIGIVTILQSLEQIKNMYEKQWGVIVDNCNTLLYLGSITHMDTLEYMSKLIGKGTFDKRTTGHTRGRQGSSNENFDVIGRELMDASEIRKLPKKNCIFIVGGKDAFYSEKYDYTSHPNYEFTSDANKAANSYDYTPQKPPEEAAKETETVTVEPDERADVSNVRQVTMTVGENGAREAVGMVVNGEVNPLMPQQMFVNDGEEDVSAEYRKMMDEEAAEKEADVSATPEQLIVRKITMETDLSNVAQYLGRNLRRLKPLEPAQLVPNDGEEPESIAVDENDELDLPHGEDEEGFVFDTVKEELMAFADIARAEADVDLIQAALAESAQEVYGAENE